MSSIKNYSLFTTLLCAIIFISIPAGVLLTIAGVNIPDFIYVIWGLALFILFTSVLIELRPGNRNRDQN